MAEKRYESDLTPKEKRHLEWEKIKGMTWGERVSHIWTYYKLQMVLILAVCAGISLVGQILYNSRFETVFYAAILNGGVEGTDAMQEDFKSYLKDDNKYHKITLDTSMFFTGVDTQDTTSVMKLTTLIGAQELDAMICTEDQYEKYADMDAFVPVEDLLTAEQLEMIGADAEEYGIRVDGSDKLQEFGMDNNTPAYVAVFAYSEHLENAGEFIMYLKEENHE